MQIQKISNLSNLLIDKKRTSNKLMKLAKLNRVLFPPVSFYDLFPIKKVNLEQEKFNKLVYFSRENTRKFQHVKGNTNTILDWELNSKQEKRPYSLKFTDTKQTISANCILWGFGCFWLGIIVGNVFLIRKIVCKKPRNIFLEKSIQCDLSEMSIVVEFLFNEFILVHSQFLLTVPFRRKPVEHNEHDVSNVLSNYY